jgi:hypothetical protein
MKCIYCIKETDCKLRKIESSLIGCEGPSEVRALKEGEVKCGCCNKIVSEKRAFKHKDLDKYICFNCY